jgi:predicted transcriptional regulator
MKLTIPAVRAAVARSLVKDHGMSEVDVADGFGIAQAAVSKYLNGKYSEKTKKVVSLLTSKGMHEEIVEAFMEKKRADYISALVDKVASSRALMDAAR